jgi:hypothetical protein
MRNIGKLILSLFAIFAGVGAYAADWNETHIYNPNWPPHAKFHNAQTMLMGTFLGLSSLFFLWRRQGTPRDNLDAGATLAALYYVTQSGSILFPGTAAIDPEFVDKYPQPKVAGIPLTISLLDIPVLLVLGGAYLLQRRSIER